MIDTDPDGATDVDPVLRVTGPPTDATDTDDSPTTDTDPSRPASIVTVLDSSSTEPPLSPTANDIAPAEPDFDTPVDTTIDPEAPVAVAPDSIVTSPEPAADVDEPTDTDPDDPVRLAPLDSSTDPPLD
jgi:hypothetical protein